MKWMVSENQNRGERRVRMAAMSASAVLYVTATHQNESASDLAYAAVTITGKPTFLCNYCNCGHTSCDQRVDHMWCHGLSENIFFWRSKSMSYFTRFSRECRVIRACL